MDTKRLQAQYVRLLYSGNTAVLDASEEANYLLAHLDHARLEVEYKARIRNLRTTLHADMKFLNRFIDKVSLLEAVESYCGSDDFWKHQGRTLLEDFCLFYCNNHSHEPRLRMLAEIEGTVSGMSIGNVTTSPWVGHQQKMQNTVEVLAAHYIKNIKQLQTATSIDDFSPTPDGGFFELTKDANSIRIKMMGGLK
ncbi:hypothetical protein IFR08_06315 [Pseudomonas fluorescens]|uniref:Uncharacterized protein n=1 Tax=Pseudomonas fluorescens TaxID=294 RepID=A0A2N1DXQ8_PSEFL|nr:MULTISPECIES: hypothetical protein [Pseudomonas]MBD8097412.1 hypothetical protein [Pseudomonas fluorescens]MBD8773384.1 hypothetical protein [Pseudomonas fluorescens]MBD8777717.1 hypothetical protein [Pseudomonas fluorescens]MBD8794319.1 hypothetical protein [Pseudomonas fluorescens]PKH15631.1 hypothetical protein CIB54_23070 [Pseudomonas fluorescens]